jgi:hypothetical protein
MKEVSLLKHASKKPSSNMLIYSKISTNIDMHTFPYTLPFHNHLLTRLGTWVNLPTKLIIQTSLDTRHAKRNNII